MTKPQQTFNKKSIKLFVSGDVMTGRGIDQILQHPSNPQLHEFFINDARDYVELAEKTNGEIPRHVSDKYIWGDTIREWEKSQVDLKIINLETTITQSENYWRGKGIHYRMHPKNISVLKSPNINLCVVANNHILDWGYEGLYETLKSLESEHIQFTGAGLNEDDAMKPTLFQISSEQRILVFAAATSSSGVPSIWAAKNSKPGVFFLNDLNDDTVQRIKQVIETYRKPNDLILFSIHWGSNWGYPLPKIYQDFSHQLIDEAKVDFIYGHSSHHPRGIEIYDKKPILYGCGDFINDYEGISGYEEYRGNLTLMYFLEFDLLQHELIKLEMVPMAIMKFQVKYANSEENEWLFNTLSRISAVFGTRITKNKNNYFEILP